MSNRLLYLLFVGGVVLAQDPSSLKERELALRRLPNADNLKANVVVPRGYAVVIGISKYKNLAPEESLSFAESDAENVYAALIGPEAGNFAFENVKKLTGASATKDNVQNALETWLPDKAQESDRVVVFFVGHGVVDKGGRGYLAPYDVDPGNLANTAYPMDRLGEVLSKKIKSRWKVLFLDACHSGKVTIDSTVDRVSESVRSLPQQFLTLVSSRAAEKSYEDAKLAGGNGVFSYFLVQGWKGEADTDPVDGIVTADELLSYVKREVKLYVRARNGQQTPVEFGDFPDDLLLGFSPKRRGRIAGTLPELANGDIIVEVNLDNVEVYVDDQRRGVARTSEPLKVPGLASGQHTVKGIREGWEPVSVEITIAPGGTQTVSLRLLHQRVIKPAAKALYEQGEKVWRTSNASASDLKNAASLFSRALKEDPAFSSAAVGLCRAQKAQGDAAEALKSCRAAVATDEANVEARAEYGTLLMETGDYPKAVRELQAAALQDPKNKFVQSLFAEALYLADRPVDAEAAANRAIALDTSFPQAYLLRGEARRAQDKLDDAAEDYRRCLKLQEFGSSAFRVAAYWTIGTGMQKHRSGRRALYRSQSEQANFGLCASENGRQNYQRAIQYCNRVLSSSKNDSETYLQLSVSYAGLFTMDNRREYLLHAKETLEAVLRLSPNSDETPQLKKKLGEIKEILGSLR